MRSGVVVALACMAGVPLQALTVAGETPAPSSAAEKLRAVDTSYLAHLAELEVEARRAGDTALLASIRKRRLVIEADQPADQAGKEKLVEIRGTLGGPGRNRDIDLIIMPTGLAWRKYEKGGLGDITVNGIPWELKWPGGDQCATLPMRVGTVTKWRFACKDAKARRVPIEGKVMIHFDVLPGQRRVFGLKFYHR